MLPTFPSLWASDLPLWKRGMEGDLSTSALATPVESPLPPFGKEGNIDLSPPCDLRGSG